jgi:hypothetical protein
MVLLWQATDSYTPPFYRGKALPTTGSEIKVVALPEIKVGTSMSNPKNLVYVWKKDYTNQPDAGGYGKNSFSYVNDYLQKSNTISVTASTLDSRYSSGDDITLGVFEPKIVFYKNDPSLGTLWESAVLDGHRVMGNEVIQAAPYYISPKEILIPTLTWDWFINDFEIAVNGFRKDLFPITTQTGTSGTSTIRLEVNSSEKIFETATHEVNVEF